MNSDKQIKEVEDLVYTLFRALVDDEDSVQVHTLRGTHNVIFEIDVAEDDVQFAIGRDSQNVEAARRIVNAKCKKLRVKFTLDVLEKRGRHAL